ncbi:MAG: SRPBCC domain-containing protein [Bacteroidales bacterium]|nr:SRPBCC domain-containing protein [Bacteroidales bacterium]
MTPKKERQVIAVAVRINAPVKQVWDLFTGPIHIIHWNNASSDWQTSYAENDLRPGGAFLSRMEARDGSAGFDFTGQYDEVSTGKTISYTMTDGRKVHIAFKETAGLTQVTESFEAEEENSADLQKAGWQAILDNFRSYVESYGRREVHHYEITIDNTPENVFRIMLAEETYREWTSPFNPHSHFTGSWDKGSKIVFLGTAADGTTGGMICRIRENIPGRFLSIESIAEIVAGKEITTGEEAAVWQGSLENYSLRLAGDKTLLSVDTDVPASHATYFSGTWPKALQKLKSLCE